MFNTTAQLRVIAAAIKSGTPALVWGDPGQGKTAAITAMAESSWDFTVETMVGSIREPSDFMGLPYIENGVVRYAPLSWVKRLSEAPRGLLFLDELTTSPPSVQKAMLRIVQEKVVGEAALPSSVSIIAAANPPSTAVGGWELDPPVANRFVHIDWCVDSDRWTEGLLGGFDNLTHPPLDRLTADSDTTRAAARGYVAGFLRHRPDLLNAVPSDPITAGKGWPSLRSWTNAATMLGELERHDTDARFLVLAGAVGDGPASEYVEWFETQDLYDLDAVLIDPSIVQWTRDRPDQLFGLLTAIQAIVQSRNDADTWTNAIDVTVACAKSGRPDVAVPLVRWLFNHKPNRTAIPPEARRVFHDQAVAAGRIAA